MLLLAGGHYESQPVRIEQSVKIPVIAGGRRNYVINNSAGGNGDYDTEVAGDSERFGFFTPTSAENFVYIFEKEQTVKDCGFDNTV